MLKKEKIILARRDTGEKVNIKLDISFISESLKHKSFKYVLLTSEIEDEDYTKVVYSEDIVEQL